MFSLPTKSAASSRVSAASALQWCSTQSDNPNLLEFAKDVYTALDNCITNSKKYKASTKKHEMMWGYFHQLRSQDNFIKKWQNFLL